MPHIMRYEVICMRFNVGGNNAKRINSIILVIISFSIILGTLYIIKRLEPDFWSRVESYAINNTEKAVNESVNDVFSSLNFQYNDLINLEKADGGEISSLTVNTIKLNLLKSKLSSKITDKITSAEYGKISINTGALYNWALLSGFGPKIRIKVHPSNQTIIEFKDSFTQAGINQVKHTLYLDVKVKFTITAATICKTSECSTSIPIADTVIVGTVPKYYSDSHLGMIGEDYEPDTRQD